MKSLSIALMLAAAVGCAMPASAGTLKPWTEADAVEHDGIINTYYLPLVSATNDTIQLATKDPAAACGKAKEAKVRFDAADAAFTTFRKRITAEGKDPALMAELAGRIDDIRPKMPNFVTVMCQKSAFKLDDPQQQADLDKMMTYVQPYMAAMADASNAMAAGDMVTTCKRFAEARVQARGLDAHLADMKTRYRADAALVAQIAGVQAESVKWKARIDELGADCPAQ